MTPGKLRFEFVEEAFYTIKPAFASGRVLAIGLQGLFQILQQLSLLIGKLHRRFYNNAAQQVTDAAATNLCHTFAA